MRVRIDYRTIYRYSRPVTFSPHEIRIFPRLALEARLAGWEFTTNAGANVTYRRDLFDNITARCYFGDRISSELRFFFEADLEIQETNPFDFLLDPGAESIPFEYSERHRRIVAPFLSLSQEELALPLPGWADPCAGGTSAPTVEALTSLVRAMHSNVAYERRDEGDPMPAVRTLTQGRGACRDFAVLLAVIMRRLGIACRLASGYLLEPFQPSELRRAESAFHAWVEVFLPGAGWIPLDGTNGIFGTHHHIGTAVGVVPEDIAPVSGSYFGHGSVSDTMHMSLDLSVTDSP